MLEDYAQLSRDQAVVLYALPDHVVAEQTAAVLARASKSLTAYFEVGERSPECRAILAPNREAFDELVADVLGVEIERPSDPRRVAQPQRTDIVLLAPSAYADESAYTYVPGDFDRMVHHELVHVFEELLSPNIEESPLWWGEGLAVYLSGQWQNEGQFRFREPALQAIRSGVAPTFASVTEDLSLAYSFGWTIVRFIEQTMGASAIVQAVRSVNDGDVLSSLGEVTASFERSWHTWLLKGEGARL